MRIEAAKLSPTKCKIKARMRIEAANFFGRTYVDRQTDRQMGLAHARPNYIILYKYVNYIYNYYRKILLFVRLGGSLRSQLFIINPMRSEGLL